MHIKAMSLTGICADNPERYIILNKDRELCSFVWTGTAAIDLAISNIDGLENLPFFISRDLYSWLKSRTPPKHRAFMAELLSQIGCSSDRAIIDYSKGLSLTDTLWVKRDFERLSWKDVSLYCNQFDETIAKVAFDGGLHGKLFKTTSPEFATDGVLPKCWTRKSDGIYLQKGGSSGVSNAGNEPYAEVMASQVLDCLGYKHVHYSLEKFCGHVVSSCKLITDERLSMIPLYLVCERFDFKSIRDCVADFGFQSDFYRMLIFDYLSLNTDRHLGNIGVLLDSDTFNPLQLAPIYDNGASMLSYYTGYQSLEQYLSEAIPALYDSFEETIGYWKRFVGTAHNVQQLINFSFDRPALGDYPIEKVSEVEKFIQARVSNFLCL